MLLFKFLQKLEPHVRTLSPHLVDKIVFLGQISRITTGYGTIIYNKEDARSNKRKKLRNESEI